MYEYPFGNGQQLNLDWFLSEWKNLLAAWEAEKNGIEGALQAEIDRAEAALADVFAARDAAAQSAANALESKNAAAQSASDASGYLATVRADANTASNAAQNAAQSESNAGDSARAAADSQTAAQNAARAAADSQTAAGNSASAAADSQTAAQNAASAAADSQTAAGNSAADAAASAAAAQAIASINDSFPSRITPLSKANSFSGDAVTIGNGFVNFTLGVETTPVLNVYNSQLLPAGTYKLVIDLLELSATGPETTRIGYISGRINTSRYVPIQDFYINSAIKRYELPITLTEPSNVEIVAVISNASGFSGSLKAFTYFDLAEPTSALGLALSN